MPNMELSRLSLSDSSLRGSLLVAPSVAPPRDPHLPTGARTRASPERTSARNGSQLRCGRRRPVWGPCGKASTNSIGVESRRAHRLDTNIRPSPIHRHALKRSDRRRADLPPTGHTVTYIPRAGWVGGRARTEAREGLSRQRRPLTPTRLAARLAAWTVSGRAVNTPHVHTRTKHPECMGSVAKHGTLSLSPTRRSGVAPRSSLSRSAPRPAPPYGCTHSCLARAYLREERITAPLESPPPCLGAVRPSQYE